MRIYLAAAGGEAKYGRRGRKAIWEESRPRYLLTSFANSPKDLSTTFNQVGPDRFFLDSGAYLLQKKHDMSVQDFYDYTDRYINYIATNGIKYFAEMDVENIIGMREVEKLRGRIETQTGRQVVPVWHTRRGIDYWKRMVSDYGYIALGDLTVRGVESYLPTYRKMVDYANARGTKVHGLGFTQTKLLPTIDFYSVDSASWSRGGAFGMKYRFTGDNLESGKVVTTEHQRTLFTELIASNFIEWCKYQRWADRNLYPNKPRKRTQ